MRMGEKKRGRKECRKGVGFPPEEERTGPPFFQPFFQPFAIAEYGIRALGDFKTAGIARQPPRRSESRRSNTRNIRDVTPASYGYSPSHTEIRERYRKYTEETRFFPRFADN